jgi:hypothetical protein
MRKRMMAKLTKSVQNGVAIPVTNRMMLLVRKVLYLRVLTRLMLGLNSELLI